MEGLCILGNYLADEFTWSRFLCSTVADTYDLDYRRHDRNGSQPL
jgi:hypothetical protein